MASKKVRVLKDIPELVGTLKEQKKRVSDKIVPVGKLGFGTDEKGLVVRVGGAAYGVEDQVHPQLAEKFGISGHYYSRMREMGAFDLVRTNLEYWRKRLADVEKDPKADKKYLVRLIDANVRGFLSSRYRPIDHLDLVTVAIQVVTGRDGEGGQEKPWAKNAKAFDWALDARRMNIGFVNPGMLIDLNHIERGVQYAHESQVKGEGGGTDFVYAGRHVQSDNPNQGGWFWQPQWKKGENHMVFPAAFIGNSETGYGGVSIQAGLYEGVCDNAARIGTNFMQRHLGRELEEQDFYSPETLKKMNAVIFSQVADVFRSVFEPELFLATARKMKGLADVEIEVKDALERIVELPGITEDIRDDILAAYEPLGSKETLLDVQRAVTAAAKAQEDHEKAIALEELGGELIEKGEKALVAKK